MTEQATPSFTPAVAVPDNTAEPLVLDGQPVAGVTSNDPTGATGPALYDPYTGALLSSETPVSGTPIFDSVPAVPLISTTEPVEPVTLEVIAGTVVTSPEQRAELVAALPIGHPLFQAAPILDPTATPSSVNLPGSIGTGGVAYRVEGEVARVEADVVAKINEVHAWIKEIHAVFAAFSASPMAKTLGL
jgi:hypothetical protein